MDDRLYEAAATGDVELLHSLLEEDETLGVLVGEGGKETPLHIASQFGHVEFVKEILGRRPEFSCQLNFQERNPLHLASAEGHTEVVKALLEKDKKACFVRDRDGMIPLHLAAIKGRVEVMKELVIAKKVTTLIKTDGGKPLLHLCLKHDRFEAVKMLIEIAGDYREFISLKDDDENTLLHLLTAKRQHKIIKLLFPDGENAKGLDVNTMNVNGSTPLDVLQEVPGRCNRIKIEMVFRSVKAKRAKELPKATRNQVQKRSLKASIDKSGKWTNRSRDTLIVVAILIASVTFQAMINPPGGVWQQDECFNRTSNPDVSQQVDCDKAYDNFHKAGNAIMSDKFFQRYRIFIISNSIGFVHSTLLILLLLCGFSFKSKRLMQYLIVLIWICVISMMITYCCSFHTLSNRHDVEYKLVNIDINILSLGCGLSLVLLTIACLFKRVNRFLDKIGIVHLFWRTMFKVKKGLVGNLKFLSNKVQNKMPLAPREDHHDKSVP